MPFRIEIAADIAACARTVPIQDEVWSGDVAVPQQLLLEIPHDIQAPKRQDPALALAWRHTLRTALEAAFTAGYAAVGFLRGADGRGAYLLGRQPARSTA